MRSQPYFIISTVSMALALTTGLEIAMAGPDVLIGRIGESGAGSSSPHPFVDMYLGSTAVSACADLAEPHDASLNTADVAAFAETLMNGLPGQ